MGWKEAAAVETFLENLPDTDDRFKPRHTAVLYVIANKCYGGSFTCTPSLRQLARATRSDTSLDPKAVDRTPRNLVRILQDLEEFGVLKKHERGSMGGRQTTNRYTLTLPAMVIKADEPQEIEGEGDKLSPPNEEPTGECRKPGRVTSCHGEGDTGVTHEGDTGVTPSVQVQHSTPPPPQEAGGGGEGAAGETTEKKQDLGGKLLEMKVYEKSIGKILTIRDHAWCWKQIETFEANGKKGAPHGVELLAGALLEGTAIQEWTPPAARGKKPEPPAPVGSPETPAPVPVEVEYTCKICGTVYRGLNIGGTGCTNCGASGFQQTVPDLVARGFLPKDRLDRLPEKARELLREKAGA